jgi:hypothetical protein
MPWVKFVGDLHWYLPTNRNVLIFFPRDTVRFVTRAQAEEALRRGVGELTTRPTGTDDGSGR